MLRSLSFSAAWMLRLGHLHAFLAKHCDDYAHSCLAVRPQAALNLSVLADSADMSNPLIAVSYFGNQLTSADGNAIIIYYCCCFDQGKTLGGSKIIEVNYQYKICLVVNPILWPVVIRNTELKRSPRWLVGWLVD